jgi:pimeloyl-ACP methyl ester carboxylesterase
MNRWIVGALGGLMVACVALFATASPVVEAGHESGDQGFEGEALPIIFVHGFNGSGAQYETQALRWASNNYPKPVTAIDRVGLLFNAQMDAFIDGLLAETGDAKVYVLGHSLGTTLMNGYLNSSPARAARVAKYIAIDGATAANCPGGLDENGDWNVPCMGIWGRGNPARAMGPDHNIQFAEQGHTEVVTSAESFAAQYRFFTGNEPATTLILPEPPGQVEVAGRVLNFPANTGIEGATVQLWEVNSATGQRKYAAPDQEVVLDATGNIGPWAVNGQQRYEITVIRTDDEGNQAIQHFYYESWLRSNYLLRLNISPLGSALSNAIRAHAGPHSGASVVRQREWWGNNTVDPTNVDVLAITTTTPDGVVAHDDVATPGTAPYTASTIAMIIFDINADGVSNTDSLTPLGPFLSGVDVYMPAPADPPNGTITFALEQRRMDHSQVINTPNWSQEAGHFMTVNFREWTQDINTWGECMRAMPSPCR